jgi:hypothetical protein
MVLLDDVVQKRSAATAPPQLALLFSSAMARPALEKTKAQTAK